MARILCLGDDDAARGALIAMLLALGHDAQGAASLPEALELSRHRAADLLLLDHRAPALRGADVVARLRAEGTEIAVIVVTGHGEADEAIAARRAGAVAHLARPVRADALEIAVADALEFRRLRQDHERLRRAGVAAEHDRALGTASAAARTLLGSIATAALTEAPVLLVGEPGCGKAWCARAIHDQGARHHAAFVEVDCAALDADALDVALGSARGGTLLLREVSAASAGLRRRIDTVLRERQATRADRSVPDATDVRLVATTTQEPDARLARFAALPIRVPPLRERREDIPVLAAAIARDAAAALGTSFAGIDGAALALLQDYAWPGNLRELRLVVEEALVAAGESPLQPFHFSAARFGAEAGGSAGIRLPSLDVVEAERLLIEEALRRTGGNRTRAAALLHMSVRTLRHKLNTTGDDR